MNYHQEDLMLDYAYRTQKNLEFIESVIKDKPDSELFEVTQLINSLLGLLVFPFEKMKDKIRNKPLRELQNNGWIIPRIIGDFPQVEDLYDLIRFLRNAVAHFNIKFIDNEKGELKGVHVWNINRGSTTWKAEMTINELRNNVYRFIELIQDASFEKSI